MARAFLLAALFLGAQFAPGVHGFHVDQDLAPHCADGADATHFCACHVDHHAPPCAICAHAAGGASVLEATQAEFATPLCDAIVVGERVTPRTLRIGGSISPRGPPVPVL